MKRVLLCCIVATACAGSEPAWNDTQVPLVVYEIDTLGQVLKETELARDCQEIIAFDAARGTPLLVLSGLGTDGRARLGAFSADGSGDGLTWRSSSDFASADSFQIDGEGGGTLTSHAQGENIDASIAWIDASGEKTDELVFDVPESNDFLRDHVVTASGELFAVGQKSLSNADLLIANEGWLIALDENHEPLWERTLNYGLLREGLEAVAIAPGGDIVAAGYAEREFPGPFQAMVYRVSQKHGLVAWRRQVLPGESAVATAVAVHDEEVIVAGHSFDDTSTDRPSDAWVAGVNANGEPLWQVRLDVALYDSPAAMAVTSTGHVVVALENDLFALTSDGTMLWHNAMAEPIRAFSVGPDGDLLAASCGR